MTFSFGPLDLLSLLLCVGYYLWASPFYAAHFLIIIYVIRYASFFNKFDVLNARLDLQSFPR